MTTIDYQWYWGLATKLADISNQLQEKLNSLDDGLDVANSAGTHTTAGTTWAMRYDQSASDVFELACLSSMAARNLGTLVHQAGANHAAADNASSGGREPIVVPTAPTGTDIEDSWHPSAYAAGGLHDTPDLWSLVEGRVKKKWADCDVGKIRTAGTSFTTFSSAISGIPNPSTTPADPPPDAAKITTAVARLFRSVSDVAEFASTVAKACGDVSSFSDTEQQQVKAVLLDASLIIAVISSFKAAPGAGRLLRKQIDEAIDMVRQQAAGSVDDLLNELDGYVANATAGIQGINAGATGSAQLWLSPMLGRYARQTDPRTGGRGAQSDTSIGAEGERRAGLTNPKKRRYLSNRKYRYPDFWDTTGRQVIEVKNKNSLSTYDGNQIKDSVRLAAGEQPPYSVVLVVDNRTQLSAAVTDLVNQGKVEVIREELYDNIPVGQTPRPFIPEPNWTPPMSRDPKPLTGLAVP